MDGGVRAETGLIAQAGRSKFLGAGDLDADGASELIWRTPSGFVEVWFMQGLVVRAVEQVSTPGPIGRSWVLEAVADLDGDLRSDFVWRHRNHGEVVGWLMSGATLRESGTIATSIGSKWHVVDAIDLDGDGRSDLVLRNSGSGDVHGWLMSGITRTASGFIRNASNSWTNVR
jgi:hypothetical protein